MAMHRVGEYIWDGKYDPDGKRRSVDPADVRVDPHALETTGVDDARSRLMRGMRWAHAPGCFGTGSMFNVVISIRLLTSDIRFR